MRVSAVAAESTPVEARPEPRLFKAAHEFEAQLMKELLAPMVHAASTDDESDSGSAGALGDFAGQALGEAISLRGGLGIADSILRQLAPAESGSGRTSSSGGTERGGWHAVGNSPHVARSSADKEAQEGWV